MNRTILAVAMTAMMLAVTTAPTAQADEQAPQAQAFAVSCNITFSACAGVVSLSASGCLSFNFGPFGTHTVKCVTVNAVVSGASLVGVAGGNVPCANLSTLVGAAECWWGEANAGGGSPDSFGPWDCTVGIGGVSGCSAEDACGGTCGSPSGYAEAFNVKILRHNEAMTSVRYGAREDTSSSGFEYAGAYVEQLPILMSASSPQALTVTSLPTVHVGTIEEPESWDDFPTDAKQIMIESAIEQMNQRLDATFAQYPDLPAVAELETILRERFSATVTTL